MCRAQACKPCPEPPTLLLLDVPDNGGCAAPSPASFAYFVMLVLSRPLARRSGLVFSSFVSLMYGVALRYYKPERDAYPMTAAGKRLCSPQLLERGFDRR